MASPYRILYTVIYIVYNLFSGVSVPGASVLGYGLPLEFSIEFLHQELLSYIWPPPYVSIIIISYTSGASVLGYGLPPIEFSTLSPIFFSRVSAHSVLVYRITVTLGGRLYTRTEVSGETPEKRLYTL